MLLHYGRLDSYVFRDFGGEQWWTASQLCWPDTACRATKGVQRQATSRDNVIRVSPRLRREVCTGETWSCSGNVGDPLPGRWLAGWQGFWLAGLWLAGLAGRLLVMAFEDPRESMGPVGSRIRKLARLGSPGYFWTGESLRLCSSPSSPPNERTGPSPSQPETMAAWRNKGLPFSSPPPFPSCCCRPARLEDSVRLAAQLISTYLNLLDLLRRA